MDEILESFSVEDLNQLLQNLLHIQCWGVDDTFYGSLVLDFGATYSMDIGDVHLDFGEWRIDTHNSAFQMFHMKRGIFSNATNVNIGEKELKILGRFSGAFVKKIAVTKDFRLQILFTNGFGLQIMCDVFENDTEYPGWIITNHEHEMILEVNPGRWSYRATSNPRYRYGSD